MSLAILFCQHCDISVCMRNYCKSYLVILPRTFGRPSLIVFCQPYMHIRSSPIFSILIHRFKTQSREGELCGSLTLVSPTEYHTSRPASFPYPKCTSRLLYSTTIFVYVQNLNEFSLLCFQVHFVCHNWGL